LEQGAEGKTEIMHGGSDKVYDPVAIWFLEIGEIIEELRGIHLVFLLGLAGCGPPGPEGLAPPMEASPLFGTIRIEPQRGELTLRLDRAPGKPELVFLGVLVNDGASGTKACYVLVEVAAGVARLVNDSGAGSVAAGADGRVENGQCVVEAGRVERTKTAVAVRLRMAGRPGFAGPKQVFTIAMDGNGQGTGLAPAGTWSIE